MLLSPLEQIAARLGVPVAQLQLLPEQPRPQPITSVASIASVATPADLFRSSEDRQQDRQERQAAVRNSPEMQRIINLPRRPAPGPEQPETVELARQLTARLARTATPYPGPLRPLQAAALAEAWKQRGLFGPIAVGYGKTLASYLMPVVLGSKRPLYIAPAPLEQDVKREFAKFAQHWRGPHPQHYPFLSYETLSSKNSGARRDSQGQLLRAELLERMQPDLLVFDEAHKLKNSTTVCQKRVRRYLQAHPETVVVAMSGTMTRHSLKDFAHIARWCLRDQSPVPGTYSDLEAWADALDEKEILGPRTSVDALTLLCTSSDLAAIEAARGTWDADATTRGVIRGAVRRRMTETPGCVSTQDGPLGIPLRIKEARPSYAGVSGNEDPAINEAFTTLRTLWQTPDGQPIADGLQLARHAKTLGLGFYGHWFNHKEFKSCLSKMLKSAGPMTVSGISALSEKSRIDRAITEILRSVENATERDTALVKAVGTLKRQRSSANSTSSWISTDLLLSSTTLLLQSSGVSATSADVRRKAEAPGAPSPLTIATKPAVCAESFAAGVTERSGAWETLLRACPVLLTIFEAACDAALPPPEWLEARRNWASFCREYITHNRRDIDSEAQVKDAVRAGLVRDGELLARWEGQAPNYDPELHTKTIWISSEAIDTARAWVAANPEGIVWVDSIALGCELERQLGISYYGGEGLDSRGRFILDHPSGTPFVASKSANGTGRNLQTWHRNLFFTTPAEQVIGRTHRPGQMAEVVGVDLYVGCFEHLAAFLKELARARYAEQVTGNSQRLVYAQRELPELDEVEARAEPRWCR